MATMDSRRCNYSWAIGLWAVFSALWPLPAHASCDRLESARNSGQEIGNVEIYIVRSTLDKAVARLARAARVSYNFASPVTNEIRARTYSGPLDIVLEKLSLDNNLVWFCEKKTLELASADLQITKTLQVDGLSQSELDEAINKQGLSHVSQYYSVDAVNNFVRMVGPPRLIARLESIIVGLKPPKTVDRSINVIKFGLPEESPK